VLLVVAASQIHRVRTDGLPPWKGGGFGMFSTVDSIRARFVRVHLQIDGVDVRAALPRDWRPFATELQAVPGGQRLEALARELLEAPWVRFVRSDNGEAVFRKLPAGRALTSPHARVEPAAVRVEVWRYHFDAPSTQLRASLVESRTARRGET